METTDKSNIKINIGKAVNNIWSDLCDRSGVGNELEACDEDIKNEIKEMMFREIRNAVTTRLGN